MTLIETPRTSPAAAATHLSLSELGAKHGVNPMEISTALYEAGYRDRHGATAASLADGDVIEADTGGSGTRLFLWRAELVDELMESREDIVRWRSLGRLHIGKDITAYDVLTELDLAGRGRPTPQAYDDGWAIIRPLGDVDLPLWDADLASSAARAVAGRPRMLRDFETLTSIAVHRGFRPHELAIPLAVLGLREGLRPTDAAITGGWVRGARMNDGRPVIVWNVQRVLALAASERESAELSPIRIPIKDIAAGHGLSMDDMAEILSTFSLGHCSGAMHAAIVGAWTARPSDEAFEADGAGAVLWDARRTRRLIDAHQGRFSHRQFIDGVHYTTLAAAAVLRGIGHRIFIAELASAGLLIDGAPSQAALAEGLAIETSERTLWNVRALAELSRISEGAE